MTKAGFTTGGPKGTDHTHGRRVVHYVVQCERHGIKGVSDVAKWVHVSTPAPYTRRKRLHEGCPICKAGRRI